MCGTEYNCFRSMKRHALKAHGYEDERKRDDAAVKFKVDWFFSKLNLKKDNYRNIYLSQLVAVQKV